MNKKYVPDCKLEWYLLGTLSEREQEEIASLERSDEELRERIEALRASDAEIWAEDPAARLAERLAERYPRPAALSLKRRARRWPATFFICGALLLILPMLIIITPALIETIEADDVYIKDETRPDTSIFIRFEAVDKTDSDTATAATADTMNTR